MPHNEVRVSAQPPEETNPPDIALPPEAATGLTAVIHAMEVAVGQMGASRTAKTLLKVNQRDGFDCPSCAWPDPDGHRSFAEFCENGAKAVSSEATTKQAGAEFFAQHSVAELSRQSDYWLERQGRLVHPMILREGGTHYEPIAWDEAFRLIAEELHALASPDEAAFYTSGRASNEAAFLYQLFVRLYGTNNLPDCSNMCHESSGIGLKETLGIGKSTVTLDDLEHSECVLVIGQNPGTNHPRMLSSLQKTVRNGGTIISANPLREVGLKRFRHPQEVMSVLNGGQDLAKIHMPVRINGDVALMKGLIRLILEAGGEDREFIAQHTSGFEAFRDAVMSTGWSEIERSSGLTRAQLEQAAQVIFASKNMIICWAMGLTQHTNAVDNIRELVNLLLVRGNMGQPRAGALCVRGHSNVQGDRTMGINERPDAAFLDRLRDTFAFEPPRHHGVNVVEAIEGMHEGRIKVLFALGGNFLSAAPDTEFTAEALRRCSLTVQVSTKLNRSHLVTGRTALILPCLGRTEIDQQNAGDQFVTVENSVSVVSMSKGVLKPAAESLLSEVQIVARLAEATIGNRAEVNWRELAGNYDLIRENIARVVPGFDDFNAKVRTPGGFPLDIPPKRREFRTATGKARFSVVAIPPEVLQTGQLMLMTTRSHDQFNTTVYGMDDRYRGIYHGRRVIFLNSEDMRERGLVEGDLVDITSHFEGETRTGLHFRAVPYEIPRRCAGAYFPEANVLVPVRHHARESHTPASKSIVITIAKAQAANL